MPKDPKNIYIYIEITNTKHPKQLNTEGKKKAARREKIQKPLPMLQKWKTIEPCQKKKTTFRKLSISFSKSLTVMNKAYGY